MLTAFTVPPVDFSLEGRGNYESWVEYGYIAKDHYATLGGGPHSRTVSRTVEYAYDDFCIAMFAKDLGYDLDHEVYLNRSGNWKNLWNPEQQDLYHDEDGDLRRSEFKGFLMPRNMNGSFVFQPVRQCSPVDEPHRCYFDTALATYEGSPWLYSFYAPHDMAGLIGVYGGRDKFIERLTFYHSSGIAYMGNEQSFLTVFQFHYGGRPGLSSYWVNQYIPSQFNNSINGIPGNDDCAMGAFSSFAMMGFFPVSGQPVYLLSTPFFNEVKVRSRGKIPAVIRKVGGEGIYIQNATLNGIPYTKNWISHEFFLRGGLLELTIGKTESKWGTRDEDLPPSYPPI
jgi:putative alpha-1,2-mannosidase